MGYFSFETHIEQACREYDQRSRFNAYLLHVRLPDARAMQRTLRSSTR